MFTKNFENINQNLELADMFKHKVIALSHDLASIAKPKKDALLIRILDDGTNYDPIRHIDSYKSVLEIYFDDIDPRQFKKLSITDFPDVKFFDKDRAQQIIQFLVDNPNAPQIIVHCHAGISRSVAVALFIAQYYFKDENNYNDLIHCSFHEPGGNQFVFHQLERALRRSHAQFNL